MTEIQIGQRWKRDAASSKYVVEVLSVGKEIQARVIQVLSGLATLLGVPPGFTR